MDNSYKFFRNKSCKYFPCHEVTNKEKFNCLFCFCPLYFLGEKCGGNFTYVGDNKDIKCCSDCLFPHIPENYDKMMEKIQKAL